MIAQCFRIATMLSVYFFAWWISASAQEQPSALWSWETCVAQAEKTNPALKSAQLQVQAKSAAYYGDFNSLLPSLSLGYSYGTSSLSQADTQLFAADNWEHQLQGNLQWDLFNWKDYATLHLSAAALDSARCDLELASAQVRLQLRTAFYQLLFAQEQIALLERIHEIRATNAQMVKLEYNSGRESKGNMLITQADLAASEADLTQSRRTLRTAQQALGRVLGLQAGAPAAVESGFYLPVTPTLETLDARLPQLPQIRRDEAQIAQSKASLQSAWSQALPNLSARYNRGFSGQTFLPTQASWSASLNLDWPIFAGGPTATYFGIASAQDLLDKAESDKVADLLQLRENAENAWSSLMSDIDQVLVQKQYQEASVQRNAEATIEYSNGLLTFENWNQVVTSLVTFEKQYLASRLNAVLAEAAWQNALELTLEEP